MVKRHNVVKSNDIVVGGLTEVRTRSVYDSVWSKERESHASPRGVSRAVGW
jgi:hypothetical protein